MKVIKLAFIFYFLLPLTLLAENSYFFSHISSEQGLSQLTVTSIFQDQYGFMWFGTRNGLNKFDGYTFEVYQNEPGNKQSLSDSHILSLTGDFDGNLWIGTNRGLNKLNSKTNEIERFTSKNNNAPHSNSAILSLYTDSKGVVWVGTFNGLYKYNKDSHSFLNFNENNLINEQINTIIGKDDFIYLGTASQGVIRFNTQTQEAKKIIEKEDFKNVRSLYIDTKNKLWIGTYNNGVVVLNNSNEAIAYYSTSNGLSSNYIRSINESPDGEMLIGSFNGLNVLTPQKQRITQYKTEGKLNGSLNHNSIYSIFIDNNQTLWIGTYAGGINYYNPYGNKFQFNDLIYENKKAVGIKGPIIEHKNSIYIATEGSGLVEMNKSMNNSSSFDLFTISNQFFSHNILKSLFLEDDKILCGTNLGTIYSFDTRTKKFSLLYDLKSDNAIYQIGRTLSGELFVAGVNDIGFSILSKDGKIKNTFHTQSQSDYTFLDIRCVLEIEKGVFLIGSRNNGLYLFDENKGEIKNYIRTLNSTDETIPKNYITSIIQDSKGKIWIGTYGGGISLFNKEKGTFTTYNRDSGGLLNNNICFLIEDKNQNLWISSLSGISKINLDTFETINYDHSSGIAVNEFTPHAGARLSNGKIIFSGNNGIIAFNPKKMEENPHIPSVVLRNLFVNNNKIIPGADDGILKEELISQKQIALNYDQTNIAIEYSGLNYILSEKNQYAYLLEGFDKEWNYTGNRRIAYYTNIPPGSYTFRVKASNNDNVWNEEGTTIQIQVRPPFWKTWWAYTLYTLILGSILYVILRYYDERKQLENKIKLEQAKAETQREFNETRNRLFTNFSHELRTPLTLIMSPLRGMIEKGENLSLQVKEQHKLMYNNTLRLLRLVNNLMDFQKKESGTLTLSPQPYDFVVFSEELVQLFNQLATSRKITLNFVSQIDHLNYLFDLGLMEKVFFNLLSNAFKNVPDGGTVEVSLHVKQLSDLQKQYPEQVKNYTNDKLRYILLEFKDSGGGIPTEQLEDIFMPFYQVAQNKHSASGTGLGLSLSKSIIELHEGIIWAGNQTNGGAVFTCILPYDEEKYKNLPPTEQDDYEGIFLQQNIELPRKSSTLPLYSPSKKHLVLVVEDNVDVQEYIASYLSEYNVLLASNGEEGVEKAIDKQPDIIISDLMMPKMDGMEMTSILKNNIRTSHIPIILLTARTMSTDIQEGYDTGADDYITKPFNETLLVTRVKNLIANRERLKEIYGKDFSLDTLGIEVSSLDEQFIQKLHKIMEENLSNTQFNLDYLSQEIGMSKATLYRKVKSITDLTPNEFIRNYRLEVAAKLLQETQLPISEVFVSIGFNSIAYFSTCFKNRYGVAPTEYMARNKKID